MRSLGLKYADLESKFGIFMPVLSMDIRYVRPALYDEMLRLETRIAKIPDDKIIFRTDIYNEKGKLVNSGTVRLFFMDKGTGKRVSTPSIIVEKLRPYFET
jgi:acyl-CoA thioester hydrolase